METAQEKTPIVLVDLSALVHAYFHLSGPEPDPNWTSTQAVAKVHALANGRPAAVCTDSRRSWRKERAPTYKANRPQQDAPLLHQMRLAEDALRSDGFPVWGADGFEADDVIASAVREARARALPVRIATGDKDLMQLVDDAADIAVVSTRDGTVFDATGVEIKFGVLPSQMRDYLTLVGDTSDNVKGVDGVGAKRAAELLRQFGTIEALEQRLASTTGPIDGVTLHIRQKFNLAREAIALGRELVTLRTDVPIPFDDIFRPRISQQSEAAMTDTLSSAASEKTGGTPLPSSSQGARETEGGMSATGGASASASTPGAVHPGAPSPPLPSSGSSRALVPMVVNGTPHEWERRLEPANLEDARTIAKWLHTSRLFASYGSPEAVFAIILAGNELGLGTLASLRGFHVIEGKPTLSADLIRALVMRSGLAEYFVPTERGPERATFTTKRQSDPSPVSLTFTIDEARQAKLIRTGTQWEKGPADMLAKTASTKLARLVYPEVTFGLYAPAEFGADEL